MIPAIIDTIAASKTPPAEASLEILMKSLYWPFATSSPKASSEVLNISKEKINPLSSNITKNSVDDILKNIPIDMTKINATE